MKKNFYKHIALIGSGKIGIRHLVGLNKIKFNIKITVIDINLASLKIAKNKFSKLSKNNKVIDICFINSIKQIDSKIDLAIIATNSFERLSVIKQLINNTELKYLVIEKVAFQSVNEFKKAISILKKQNIKSWVNCSGRIQNLYVNIKKIINKEKRIEVFCFARNYNIASNAIHLLDRLVFFSNSLISNIDLSLLRKKIFKSKRKNYLEFKGCFVAYTKRGDQLIILDDNDKSKEIFLNINTNNFKIIIYPTLNLAFCFSKENNWKVDKIKYDVPQQSELTSIFVNDIIMNGKCGLTNINQSYLIHKTMLSYFLKFINKINNKKTNSCMIT